MPRKPRGYSRVDSETQKGWLVRIKRGDVRRSKFVSDSAYGGKRKSENAAKQIYQEWMEELPEPETSQDKLGKRNTSGVVGVHYARDVDGRYPDCIYEYYIASWKTADGRRAKIRFSFNKWGKKACFEMACIAREHRLTDLDQVTSLYERTKKKSSKKKAKSKVTKKRPNPSA